VKKAIKENLPAVFDVLRFGCFRLAGHPFTEEMNARCQKWKTNMQQQLDLQSDKQKKEKKQDFAFDFTWDPLLLLMRKMEKRVKEEEMKPNNYYFVSWRNLA
jgi:hypothetical protein